MLKHNNQKSPAKRTQTVSPAAAATLVRFSHAEIADKSSPLKRGQSAVTSGVYDSPQKRRDFSGTTFETPKSKPTFSPPPLTFASRTSSAALHLSPTYVGAAAAAAPSSASRAFSAAASPSIAPRVAAISPGSASATAPHVSAISATITPQTVLQQRQRYLKKIVLSFGRSGPDFWHLMTTTPDNYPEKCNALKGLLKANDGFVQKTFKLMQMHPNDFVDSIYNALFGESGVYYITTQRNYDCVVEPTLHNAQTIIFEELNGKIKFTQTDPKTGLPSERAYDHKTKGINIRNMLQGIIVRLDKISRPLKFTVAKIDNKRDVARLKALLDLIEIFMQYFSVHIDCLNAAISFNKDMPLLDEYDIEQSMLSSILRCWHPQMPKFITPNKDASSKVARTMTAQHEAHKKPRVVVTTPMIDGVSDLFADAATLHNSQDQAGIPAPSSVATEVTNVRRRLFDS
jgi:hypothetical protein